MKKPDKIEQIAVDDLLPYAKNSRTHSSEQVAQIAASMVEFGWTNPVLIDANGMIVAGHGRVLAARKLKMDSVPCIRLGHLTPTQARAYVIADNKLALNAGWDDAMLKAEIDVLKEEGFEIELTGFSDDEIDSLLDVEVVEGNTDPDDVPEAPVDPITKPGDLWILGNHRLLCGDSTSIDAVQKLMDGFKADICFTSPPYGLGKSISLSGNTSMSGNNSAYDKHEDNPKEWHDMMNGWWNASLTAVEYAWVVNVQPLAGNKRDLIRWINERIERLIDIITWDKGHAAPQMAPGVLASRYEWMIGIGKNNASRSFPMSSWRGTLQSVYEGPPQKDNKYASIHAATMPIHVPEWVISTLCDQSKSIYEPFCGTGTTLIACERFLKICYAMEISPSYCDVIVKRWEEFTGRKAERK